MENHPWLQANSRWQAFQGILSGHHANLKEFRLWVANEVKLYNKHTDQNGRAPSTGKSDSRLSASQWTSVLVANGALSLLNLCIYLLDRQMKAQARAFEQEGGFTERMHRIRSETRKQQLKGRTNKK